ncbi:TPA: hypothetical protein ACOEBL_004587, partial [Enterobacter cloacae]
PRILNKVIIYHGKNTSTSPLRVPLSKISRSIHSSKEYSHDHESPGLGAPTLTLNITPSGPAKPLATSGLSVHEVYGLILDTPPKLCCSGVIDE